MSAHSRACSCPDFLHAVAPPLLGEVVARRGRGGGRLACQVPAGGLAGPLPPTVAVGGPGRIRDRLGAGRGAAAGALARCVRRVCGAGHADGGGDLPESGQRRPPRLRHIPNRVAGTGPGGGHDPRDARASSPYRDHGASAQSACLGVVGLARRRALAHQLAVFAPTVGSRTLGCHQERRSPSHACYPEPPFSHRWCCPGTQTTAETARESSSASSSPGWPWPPTSGGSGEASS